MTQLDVDPEQLIAALMRISVRETVCVLDSCGVRHLGSHLLIAGIRPIEVIEILSDDVDATLATLDTKLTGPFAAIFSFSYGLGLKVQKIRRAGKRAGQTEPDVFLALFDCLIVHDYDLGQTFLTGNTERFEEVSLLVASHAAADTDDGNAPQALASVSATSSFERPDYIVAVESIQDHIRSGDTYQANLTQQIRCELPPGQTPQKIFTSLRRDHPAPFAAFLRRTNSTVVSASPERFFRIETDGVITASPIKGTRRRGATLNEDASLRSELLTSEKDRAENTMIVDLVRNDLGRVCEYGSVLVEKLCDLEEHPTLFHLVSTVRGQLRNGWRPSQILRALFPCGSITGAPKIRTMQIIEELERFDRGLSMGAIGCYMPNDFAEVTGSVFDLSVAIRTMVIRGRSVEFNVGGGIVIDSVAESEYQESLLKASALLRAIGARLGD